MKRKILSLMVAAALTLSSLTMIGDWTKVSAAGDLADYVNTLVGAESAGHGSTFVGPTLPNGAISPSPETSNPSNGGYVEGQPVTGFGQLYLQGCGGTFSYGNFFLSPQTGGIQTSEANHASPVSDETAKPYCYTANLTKYNIKTEISAAQNTAIYRFTYPAGSDASLLLDISRKLGNTVALNSGSVAIDAATGTVTGGGTFSGNWNPAPFEMYFAMQVSAAPTEEGVWDNSGLKKGILTETSPAKNTGRLGAYFKFDTTKDTQVLVKIAISFKSVDQAKGYLTSQIPAWDFDAVEQSSKTAWDGVLSSVTLGGNVTDAQKERFYSALYQTNTQPRDTTSDIGNWDDYMTCWDSWKTEFPLLSITRPDTVSSIVNSLINRAQTDKMMGDCYTQGKEFAVGQGGNDVDNIIVDAFLKQIPGVDWNAAYAAVKQDADTWRTPQYLQTDWQYSGTDRYTSRLYPASSTLGFAYNDYGVSLMAKTLGTAEDYQKYSARGENWLNVWDPTATSDGYTGFPRNRHQDGTFSKTDPTAGYDTDFYEATGWEAAYTAVYDLPTMIQKMGGETTFIARLRHALDSGYIDFSNEPSFQTLWLFSSPEIRHPDLTAYYENQLFSKFTAGDYPGDEDGGAMSSLYVFLDSGFFPISGTNNYYIGSPHLPDVTYHLGNGKTFEITADNLSDQNIYIQSATLNGKPLNDPYFTYDQLMAGGTLHFEMCSSPSTWGYAADTAAPSNVTGLAVDSASLAVGACSLFWNTATDNDGIRQYQIYRGTTADFTPSSSNLLATTSAATYCDLPEQAGTYYYKVLAQDYYGNLSASGTAVEAALTKTADAQTAPGDLCLNKTATANGATGDKESAPKAVDGDTTTKWCCKADSADNGAYWLEVDLGADYLINRWVVKSAGVGGETAAYDTSDYKLQIKDIFGNWQNVDSVTGNSADTTDRTFTTVAAQHARLYITKPVQPGMESKAASRIYEFELYSPSDNTTPSSPSSTPASSTPVSSMPSSTVSSSPTNNPTTAPTANPTMEPTDSTTASTGSPTAGSTDPTTGSAGTSTSVPTGKTSAKPSDSHASTTTTATATATAGNKDGVKSPGTGGPGNFLAIAAAIALSAGALAMSRKKGGKGK